jgi:predicted DNA-binding protein
LRIKWIEFVFTCINGRNAADETWKQRGEVMVELLEAPEMAKKPAPKTESRDEHTSVRLSKAMAKKLSVLGKHKGKTIPQLIDVYLKDVVAEEYHAMLDELKAELDGE